MGFFQGSKYSYCTTLAADIIAFIAGTSIGWSSPAIAILESDITRIPLNKRITEEASWIVSLLPLGGVFGPFIFGFFIQTIGRKITVIMIAFPFLIAYLIAAFAKTVWQLYVARILMGIGLGGVFGVVPIFIVEIVEDVNRGLLLASPICFSTLETPYYLIRVNKEEKALESLYYLRRKSRDDLLTELKAIKSHLSEKITQGSLLEIFKTKAFFYSVVLTTLQQYSGATIILYFAKNIFENAGNNIAPEISSIIIALVQFVVSFISLPLIDKCGRRILLLVSYFPFSIDMIGMAGTFWLFASFCKRF
ncbi:Sugar tr and/or MFS 1 domain containing protein [Asbolus verrucosus]|uniref:Sugar tr and/or MFS 1 domain containing protein n=1 Tax=Asbolus verrucosus TaxID=1661398 RepID=A0A482W1A9_ASBVE|nr:Sugar tr and/or MFS 1 domain containing protein [Asbolus verrucosus]